MTDTGPFADIASYQAIDRVGELRLSPDGTRLVATVSALADDGSKRVESLWELDPHGDSAPRRLTWSDRGESAPRWLPDGSLLFLSARGSDDEQAPSALWLLPAQGGEARKLVERPGGFASLATSKDAMTVVASSATLPRAGDAGEDERLRKERKDRKVNAVLHESSPVRFWDHDLGPAELRLLAFSVDGTDPIEGRDLTPAPARALDEQSFVASPDGRTVVTGWAVDDEPGFPRPRLVAIDVATGEQRVLANEPYVFFADPAFSPDGRRIACVRVQDSSYDEAPRPTLWLLDVATGEGRAVAPDADLWPAKPQWFPDGSGLFFGSDHQGHHPIFRVALGDGVAGDDGAAGDVVTKLTRSGHYASVSVSPDGARLYALRDHIDSPPTPVWVDANAVDGDPHVISSPGQVGVPGRLEEVNVTVGGSEALQFAFAAVAIQYFKQGTDKGSLVAGNTASWDVTKVAKP